MQDVPFNDQRTVTDDQFLDHLTLPGEAGRQLAAARKGGNAADAVKTVAHHFRTRKSPRWPFYMHGTPWLEINGRGLVLEKAEALLKNKVRNCWPPNQEIDLGPDLEWQKGFEGAGTTICRCTFLPELTTAFSLTGKVAYLTKARELMKSIVATHPWVLHEGFYEDHDRYFGTGYTLDLISASKRWIDLMHSGALHVPNVFSDEDVFWMIKQLWFFSMQYYRYVGDVMRRDNHHLGDHGNAPFVLGMAFPEFSVSGELIEQGRKTIQHHFKNNVYIDVK
jgi:hypothetical protein